MIRVGLDYRPALQNREGIGRYTRELVAALETLRHEADAVQLELYGSTLAPARVAPGPETRADGVRLRRWRVPSRWHGAWLGWTGGVDGFHGGLDAFHHTQYHHLPVRRSAEVATLHDLIYLLEPEYVDTRASTGMREAALRAARNAAAIVVPSQFVADQVVRQLDVSAERVFVTPLGCDHVERSPASAPGASAPYVLTVTRIEPRKNHIGMLRAFEGLVAGGARERWIVAGPHGYRADAFLSALARSPARDRVEVLEQVSETKLGELYSHASAFLFTSLSEGFGLPPLEAMACGLPVVASSTTSVAEVCGDGALLVDPADPGAATDALRSVLEDTDRHAELAARARERAATFTWERCARATLAAYAFASGAGPGVATSYSS